ncbi:MAG: chromosome segregation SMC family protein [Candidatus Nitrosocaldaceae archaeon]
MVHIKKVEIYGFKSFGFTNKVINLEKGMMCITGPNGSGKSNILDAIAFALGENSPKSLRVDKLHSLFHDDNNEQKRKNIRVSVTFDNSDRVIPVDANSVTITREMPFDGDSIYYLNGKHVSKSTITDLLDVALATPNRLNNVQQGMIMRIAELNSEERRKILEDIIGLSYFDKKKEEALKQLDDADRKLEVALARMSEIRKRIDELEVERNNQIRFYYLEKEIKRLNAIKLSRMLKESKQKSIELEKIIEDKSIEYSLHTKEAEEIKIQLSQLEEARNNIMKDVDMMTKNKAELSSKISSLIMRSEQLKSMKTASEQRIKSIGSTISSLIKEEIEIEKRVKRLEIELGELESETKLLNMDKGSIAEKIKELNDKLGILNKRLIELSEDEDRLSKVFKEKEVIISKLQSELTSERERLKIIIENMELNIKRLDTLREQISRIEPLIAELESIKIKNDSKIKNMKEEIVRLEELRDMLVKYTDDARGILDYASKISAKYDAKISVAKDDEYYAAMLKKDSRVIGLVRELINYDEYYAKAVIAAIREWINGIVVRTVSDAIAIIEKAKSLNIPKIRVIPLDILERLEFKKSDKHLSMFVKSDYTNLTDFLLDYYLVNSPYDARRLAQEGYNVVTLEGQVFNANLSSLRLENVTLKDITKIMILTDSLEVLKEEMARLDNLYFIKKDQLKRIEEKIVEYNKEVINTQSILTDTNIQLENLKREEGRCKESYTNLMRKIEEQKVIRGALEKEIILKEEKIANLTKEKEDLRRELERIDKKSIVDEININNIKKRELISALEEKENSIRKILTDLSAKKAEYSNSTRRLDDIKRELERIKRDARERRSISIDADKELAKLEKELRDARELEQKMINTSSNSISLLKEYDIKIKELIDKEKKITKHLATIEKDLSINMKERNYLNTSIERISSELSNIGYKEVDEVIDVEDILKELTKEYDEIKHTINQLADKSYKQLIEGYKGISTRRNQLEEERNSIVRFIEDIDKEKRKIFMESFEKVDKDIRYIFSTMTDNLGSAWLEVEDTDNIFESGLSLMIQFPNKPARESTSLSGGEKTIAAITFLLALQSLRSSPYYLFDEVDAHLDAQNTERLLKILIEKSKVSQMIIVTLKDMIASHANLVYGVYAKNGVSNIIKYKSNIEVTV